MSRVRTRWIAWPLALLVIALFVWLGFWQLARMHEKQALLDASHAVLVRRQARPLALAGDPHRVHGYDWATGEGHFLARPTVLLDNQSNAGRSGVRAYRAFQSADAAAPVVLVDLGWLPLGGDRHLPTVPRPAGLQHVAGLLAPPPASGFVRAVALPQPDGNVLAVNLDLPVVARALRLPALAPRVLKLDPALPLGYTRDLDILPNTLPPSRHLGYAVQWFGLALTVLVTAIVLTLRGHHRETMR